MPPGDTINKWETYIQKIKTIAIYHSKERNKINKLRLSCYESVIEEESQNPGTYLPENIADAKANIFSIYKLRNDGFRVRNRIKWDTKYNAPTRILSNLEKRQQSKSAMLSLLKPNCFIFIGVYPSMENLLFFIRLKSTCIEGYNSKVVVFRIICTHIDELIQIDGFSILRF